MKMYKISTFLVTLFLFGFGATAFAQYDDVYFDPSTDTETKYETSYDDYDEDDSQDDDFDASSYDDDDYDCLLYTSPSPRDLSTSRMPSSA